MRLSIHTFVRSFLILMVVLIASPMQAALNLDLALGGVGGSFAPENTVPVTGWQIGFSSGYQYVLGDHVIVSGGLLGNYSNLTYSADDLRKIGSLYQMGLDVGALIFFGEAAHIELRGGIVPYSQLYVDSDSNATVNDNKYRTQIHSRFSGGVGTLMEVGFLSQDRHPRTKKQAVRFGVMAGLLSRAFSEKKERTQISVNGDEVQGSTLTSKGPFTANFVTVSLVLGGVL